MIKCRKAGGRAPLVGRVSGEHAQVSGFDHSIVEMVSGGCTCTIPARSRLWDKGFPLQDPRISVPMCFRVKMFGPWVTIGKEK